MQIISTSKLEFRRDHHTYGGDTFTTMGGGNVENAPDWIMNDPYFAGALGEGVVTIIGNKPENMPPPPSQEQAARDAGAPEHQIRYAREQDRQAEEDRKRWQREKEERSRYGEQPPEHRQTPDRGQAYIPRPVGANPDPNSVAPPFTGPNTGVNPLTSQEQREAVVQPLSGHAEVQMTAGLYPADGVTVPEDANPETPTTPRDTPREPV